MFSTHKLISQAIFSWRFLIKLFMHLETVKQMRLRNPSPLSYSRATHRAGALWSVAEAGAHFAGRANLWGLSRS